MESTEAQLTRRLELERLVAGVSSILLDLTEEKYDEIVNAVLRRIGEFTGVERCLLVRASPGREVLSATHEWHAPGAAPLRGRLQGIASVGMPWLIQGLLDAGEINIADTDRLPPEAAAERHLLRELGIRSALAVPLRRGGRFQGFLGIHLFSDAGEWSPDDVRLLKIIAQLMASAFDHFEADRSLRQSKALAEDVSSLAHLGSWEWEPDRGRMVWSPEVFRILGQDPERFTPSYSSFLECAHPDDRERQAAQVGEAMLHRKPLELTSRFVRPDGGVRHVRLQAIPQIDADGHVQRFVGFAHDVTELQRAQAAMERANRSLLTISACNAALVRATDEKALLQDICRILVETGKHRLAWVAGFDQLSRPNALPVAFYGCADRSFFAAVIERWREGHAAPFVTALETRRVAMEADLRTANLFSGQWWESRGLISAIALPIMEDDELFGVIEVYDDFPDAFSSQADLLRELVNDLAFGIGALRARRQREEAERALRTSEQSLRSTLERQTDGVIVMDRSARILFANPAAETMLGRSIDTLRGEPFAYPVVRGENAEISLLRPDGSLVTAEMRAADTEWLKIPAVVVAMRDVTEQRRAEEQQRIWATVLEHSGEMIFVTDANKHIVAVNHAFEAITGYSAQEVMGRSPRFLSSGVEDDAFYRELWNAVEQHGHWQGEIRDRRKNGEVLPLWIAITAARNTRGSVDHYIAIGSDVSERKAAEERIQFLAYHDALTGLPNRLLFKDRVDLALTHASRVGGHVAVLFLDLDRFKNVNDSLGHSAGDELLKDVAARIMGCVRREDTISRQGGDEFLVLLALLSAPDDAAQVASKVLSEIGRPFRILGTEVHITASIGIALYPEDGEDTDVLVRNADAAMYYAKESGRDNYQFFIDDLNLRVSDRLSLENDLRRALALGEFELYYQPQVNARTGKLVGIEALLRWHRGKELIEPDSFVAIAEETGLIIPIGEWVVRQACRQAGEWRRAGMPPVRMAVNLSAVQFRQREAFDRLLAIMVEASPSPGMLEMELTEGVLMREADSNLRSLRELKEIGIGLAIDDFGTGYSSLSYLRRFPIDRLKVDRSFVQDLATDPTDRAVTEAIIALARSLHLGVVAEGVETEEEMRLLQERNCEALQGFYFSRPLPANELVAWWKGRL